MFTRVLVVALSLVTSAQADWLKVGDADFVERLAVTVSNDGPSDNPAALVDVKLSDLTAKMPSAGKNTVAVGDESNSVVAWQISNDHLLFVTPVKAKSKTTVFVYASTRPFAAPKFDAKTGADMREAWRSFENEFAAFRVEIGDKAKTTGLTLDTFGKTGAGRGAILKQIYASDYHQRQTWGIDTLKVGKGPGLGGVYLVVGDKMGRTDAMTTTFTVAYEGPIATKVIASGPAEIDGKKFQVMRWLTLLAGDRSVHDTLFVKSESPDALKDLRIGLGLRDLPEQQWIEHPTDGYAFVTGKGNQKGTERLGLGMTFNPDFYDRTLDTTGDKENDGHIYILKPHGQGNSVHIHSRLFSFWDGDGWVSNAGDFETLLARDAKITASKIELSERAEKH